jgi:AcrR family transcriptional regulator
MSTLLTLLLIASYGALVKRAGNEGTSAAVEPLTAERIVAAASEIAETFGLSEVTMRSLGAHLGVDATAMYRHFPNKAALLLALADRVFARIIVDVDPQSPWRERLRVAGAGARSAYREYPTLVSALANLVDEVPALTRLTEIVLQALRDAGLSEPDIGLYQQVLLSAVIGAGYHDASWGPAPEQARAGARDFYRGLPLSEFPNATALSTHLFPDLDLVFDTTVEVLLDVVEAVASATTKEATS